MLWYWIVSLIIVVVIFLSIPRLRINTISKLLFIIIQKLQLFPKISSTEMAAIKSGNTGVEGYFFRPSLDIKALQNYQKPILSDEEKAYLAGPVEQLCKLVNDWEIWTHGDLPEKVWQFLRNEKFFGIIIPKKYGGLGFSRLAHSEIILKLSSRSIPVAITAMVPNSLGPAELLLKYGTEAQKERYLPKLAAGEEIPCFALTEPEAGSDASSLQSEGILIKQDGEIKIQLSWEKRWITLGAVSTLMGVAFVLRDPDNLLEMHKTELGITCALVPADSTGISKECRHDPLGVPFVNSRLSGKNVIVSLDAIIGEKKGIGQGWLMLTECLAAGRGISLPAQTTGGAKLAVAVTTAHSFIRQQFGQPINKFEGVKEPLAHIAGLTFMMNATRNMSISAMDKAGVLPVISAIVKYNFTEFNRSIFNDAMDILGGSGITMGPHNQVAHGYIAAPIGITVEGSNILTRSLMIFGQGAIRAHPYIFNLMGSIIEKDLNAFDKNTMSWLKDITMSFFNALACYLTRGRILIFKKFKSCSALSKKSYFRLGWATASFYYLNNLAMLILGGVLKRKEHLTGRFADCLSWLVIIWSTIEFFEKNRNKKDLDILAKYSIEYGFYQIEIALEKIIIEFGGKYTKFLWRYLLLPLVRLNPLTLGPKDKNLGKVCSVLYTHKLREFLLDGMFRPGGEDPAAQLESTFQEVYRSWPVYQKIKSAIKEKRIAKSNNFTESIEIAKNKSIINENEYQQVYAAEKRRKEAIKVDSFCD